jgi:hypothetical protein
MPNSASGNSGITLPLSPAERSRLYSRIIGRIRKRRRFRIRIKAQQVKALVKRGYLGTCTAANRQQAATSQEPQRRYLCLQTAAATMSRYLPRVWHRGDIKKVRPFTFTARAPGEG